MPSLFRKLLNDAVATRCFTYGVVELTYRCNYRCPFCYVDHDAARDELDLKAWARIIEDMRAAGCVMFLITGGEPLLHRDCIDVLRKAKEVGLVTSLFTNAALVHRGIAADLAGLRLAEIGISLYGADAETHDAYTRSPGAFQRVLDAIGMLKGLGCNVQLRWNAIPGSVAQTAAFIDLAERLGAEWHCNGLITPHRDGRPVERVSDAELRDFYRVAIERYQPLADAVEEAHHLAGKLREPPDPNARICRAGHTSGRVDPRGIFYPCIDLHDPIGDLTQAGLVELWEDSPAWEPLKSITHVGNFPTCSQCRYVNACRWSCPAAFKSETGSYFSVSRESCRNMEAYLLAMSQYLDEKIGRADNPLYQFTEADHGEADPTEARTRHREEAARRDDHRQR
jgi:radical SAM protein with 4Fe4S-binding SPASM domain